MHFELSEEHKAVQQAAREFAQNVLKAGVIDRDEHQKFPAEEVKQLGELGFMGMMVSPEYGGSGMDTLSYVLAMEEISKIDASTSVCMSVNNLLVTWGLESFGSEEQKQKYLVPLAKGEKIGAFCFNMLGRSEGATRSIAWTAIWQPVEMTAIRVKRDVGSRYCMTLDGIALGRKRLRLNFRSGALMV